MRIPYIEGSVDLPITKVDPVLLVPGVKITSIIIKRRKKGTSSVTLELQIYESGVHCIENSLPNLSRLKIRAYSSHDDYKIMTAIAARDLYLRSCLESILKEEAK